MARFAGSEGSGSNPSVTDKGDRHGKPRVPGKVTSPGGTVHSSFIDGGSPSNESGHMPARESGIKTTDTLKSG